MLRAWLAVGVLIWAGSAPAAACEAAKRLRYNEPVELEGMLRAGTGQHDAQGAFRYSYVELDAPVCVDTDGNNEFEHATQAPVNRVQLAGEEAGKDLPLGKRVAVSGMLFGAHTMWHVEDVLIDATSVAPR
jgi:hypothetical protein